MLEPSEKIKNVESANTTDSSTKPSIQDDSDAREKVNIQCKISDETLDELSIDSESIVIDNKSVKVESPEINGDEADVIDPVETKCNPTLEINSPSEIIEGCIDTVMSISNYSGEESDKKNSSENDLLIPIDKVDPPPEVSDENKEDKKENKLDEKENKVDEKENKIDEKENKVEVSVDMMPLKDEICDSSAKKKIDKAPSKEDEDQISTTLPLENQDKSEAKSSEGTLMIPNAITSSPLDDKTENRKHFVDVGDVSVRSRYGRVHKPKPLIDGFLTTDKKVGAFLGHSPQNSPRKKDEPIRLSLKGFKKTSPPKKSAGETLIAALKSLQNDKKSVSPIMDSKPKATRGRPPKIQRVSNHLNDTVQTDSPAKLPADESVNGIGPCTKKLFTRDDNVMIKKGRNKSNKSFEESPKTRSSAAKTETSNDQEKTAVEDLPAEGKDLEKTINKETERVEDAESMVEKESDSGVESSATAPSEPEDGVVVKEERQADKGAITLSQGEWLVGDLVWGHIKGHPFWPCIVVHEPEQGICIKTQKVGRNKQPFFHVRFFGDNARRSWISYKQIIRFNSSEDYLRLIEEYPTRKKDFEVTPKNIPKWKFAIQEAEKLVPLSRSDRLETFTNMYPHVLKDETEENLNKSVVHTPKKRGRKRLRPSSSPSSSDNESPHKDGLMTNKQSTEKKRYKVKRKRIKRSVEPFEAFCEKHRDRVVDEHPDLNADGIEQVLHQRWETMEDNIKARYDTHSKEGSTDSIKSSDEDDEVTVEEESEASSSSKAEIKQTNDKRKYRKSFGAKMNVSHKHGGLFKGLKSDKVCIQCEQPGGEVLKCKGPCVRFFHAKCAPDKSKGICGSEDFKCGDCVTDGKPPCAACWKEEKTNKKDDDRKKCNQHGCGRFYHEECLANWPQAWWSRQTFTCPAHCCHTCASDDPRESRMHTSHTEKLVRCIRCPATYHSGDFCLPAGCIVLTGSQILCQRHYKIPTKGAYHMNTSWCFICSMGGSLICCDRCPTSFHPQCLNITAPEGSYICEDCDSARYPLYGEVAWVKLGRYRWWPAEILYPREVPENVQLLPHALGEFAVRFFGSHDHYWVNNGRAFLYQEGDSAKTAPPKSGTDALFARALQEAAVCYQKRAKEKAEWEAANVAVRNNGLKPPQFVRIKTNKPVGDVKPFETVHASDTPCDCDPKTEKPCSQEPNCLNRMLMVECDPGVCRAGERCCNQRFQKRQYPPLSTCRTEGRGWGLQTLADISQGDFVIEYVGEMINEAECHRRMERMHSLKDENYYFLTIDRDHILDAGPKGNLSRFMNHSCNPNCETQKWTVGGETRVGLFALCDIPAGTELTFNYNLQVIGTERRPCLCGAPNCIRFIGAKSKSEPEESNGANSSEVPVKKPKLKSKKNGRPSKLLNQICQKCSHGGELITCVIKSCGKYYHPSCVQLSEESIGQWSCPLHQCALCKAKPNFHCSDCSYSFCRAHVLGNVIGKISCSQHIKQESQANGLDVEKPKEDASEEKAKSEEVTKESKAKTPRQRSMQKNRLAQKNES